MDEISESITQIRIVHVAQRVLAEGELTAVRSFLTEIPASFFSECAEDKEKIISIRKRQPTKSFFAAIQLRSAVTHGNFSAA